MALTFQTSTLISIIDSIIADVKAADDEYAEAKKAARDQHRDEFLRDGMPRVRHLRDYLTRCLSSDTPPDHSTAKMVYGVDERYNNGIRFFTPGGDSGVLRRSTVYARIDELQGIAELLRAHHEPTITSYQLKELGTHPRDLEKLFRAAALAGAQK